MALEHNIKCDWENCTQRYLSEPHNWWLVYQNTDDIVNRVEIIPFTTKEYQQLIEDGLPGNSQEKQCCCLDHALKQVARFCEELLPKPDMTEPRPITEDDIPF